MTRPIEPLSRVPGAALAMLDRQPWAITETALRSLRNLMNTPFVTPKQCGIDDDEACEPDDDAPPVVTLAGDVAIVTVRGPMFQYHSWYHQYLGCTSYEAIENGVDYIASSDKARSVLFAIDSPGGSSAGNGDLAAKIRSLALRKPVVAFVPGQACSAGYYLASACREVVASPRSLLGSIGTMTILIDDTGYMEQLGLKEIPVVSAGSPNKYPDITSDAGLALYQGLVDSLGELFIADVAKYRGVSARTVKADFGAGWVKVGQDAVDAGLADRLGTLDEVVSQLASGYRPRAKGGTTSNEGSNMARKVSAWSKFKSLVQSVPDDDDETEFEVAPAPEAKPDPADSAAHAPPADSAEVVQLRSQLAEETRRREAIESKQRSDADKAKADAEIALKASADAFASAEIRAGRATPDQSAALVGDFMQAARDDAERPTGGASRVDRLKSRQSGVAPHGMTSNVVEGRDAATLSTLANDGKSTDAERRRKEVREGLGIADEK